jgi:AcrR family transcriptional regulator
VRQQAERLSGRRAQAARNNEQILRAAREVFTTDPQAPIAAVARRAGVGISALYRRYRSKDELLQLLALDGLKRYIAEVEAALSDSRDPWMAFARFMERALDAGTGSITARFNAGFPTTKEMHALGRKAADLTGRLLDRVKRAGQLRRDINVSDIALVFEQLQSVEVAPPKRKRQLRQRYLALVLDALRQAGASPLPGPAPRWDEISGRYRPPAPRSEPTRTRRP